MSFKKGRYVSVKSVYVCLRCFLGYESVSLLRNKRADSLYVRMRLTRTVKKEERKLIDSNKKAKELKPGYTKISRTNEYIRKYI